MDIRNIFEQTFLWSAHFFDGMYLEEAAVGRFCKQKTDGTVNLNKKEGEKE